MLPILALLFGFAFTAWMIGRDRRWRRLPSRALWIPGVWLALASSRQMSFWLKQVGVGGDQASNIEGSPVNVIFNGSLFLAAILVLNRRRFSWGQFAHANKALSAIYLFFLCSMLWSPYPVSTVKRLVQDFGCVLTGLVILTEKDPAASLRVVFVRVSYILFPLSVIFIRFFPEIGRVVSSVSGTHMLCGVTGHKNLLGQMTMVFCLVLLWDLMNTRKYKTDSGGEPERLVRLMNLGIGLYLLVLSSSATSSICFLLGLALLFSGKRLAQTKDPSRLFIAGTLAVVLVFGLDQMYGISSQLSETLERGSGLSGRTEIWRVILRKDADSLVGAGFRGFWETSVGESIWSELGTNELITAHNGYLETYLNGGFVGLVLLCALLWATGRDATARLVRGEPLGRLAVVFWPILLLYNVTETQYFQTASLWFTTLLVLIDSPWQDRHAGGERRRDWRRRLSLGRPRGLSGQDRPPTLASPFSPNHS